MITENEREKTFLKATLIASSLSGFLGKLLSHPLDTVKAKAQVSHNKKYNYYLEKYYYQGRFFSNEFAKCCFKSIYHPNNKINVFS